MSASKDRKLRAGIFLIAVVLVISLFADCLASDLPIAMRYNEDTYLLPNIFRPQALRAFDNQELRADKGLRWALYPLVEYGSVSQPKILKPPPASPDNVHIFGTDDRGRDVFARVVHGGRISLFVALVAVFIYVLIGVVFGLLSGYFGGWVDFIISRIIEVALTFPTFFLIIILMALLDGRSIWTLILVIGLSRWTDIARLVRAEVLRLREYDYVVAAKVMGMSPLRIMLRHLLPKIWQPVIVNATFGLANIILVESALSFLGFGVPAPIASWGEILGEAYHAQHAWWLVLFAGVMIVVTVFSINLIGERLSERLLDKTESNWVK